MSGVGFVETADPMLRWECQRERKVGMTVLMVVGLLGYVGASMRLLYWNHGG